MSTMRMDSMRRTAFRLKLGLTIGLVLLPEAGRADGCFVVPIWNKQRDINEPTQKAIILYDKGREDLILQVKYEGPADQFGWLIPVPGLPEVRKGSMEPFYELGEVFAPVFMVVQSLGATENSRSVHLIETKAIGVYKVAVLSAGDAGQLKQWLETNEFNVPNDNQGIIENYVKKGWYFVAVKVDPEEKNKKLLRMIRRNLAKGELYPLIISFDSEKCIFPLAISALNGKPSELSLYVISERPLVNRSLFDKRADVIVPQAEMRTRQWQQKQERLRLKKIRRTERYYRWHDDPKDPPPDMEPFFAPLEVAPSFGLAGEYATLKEVMAQTIVQPRGRLVSSNALPRLKGQQWWITKQVGTFLPSEMHDLEFEPSIAVMTDEYRSARAPAVTACLRDPRARDWREADSALPLQLLAELNAPNPFVRIAAGDGLRRYNLWNYIDNLKDLTYKEGPAASEAIQILWDRWLNRSELIHYLSSTNIGVILTAIKYLGPLDLDEITPLVTNSLPLARFAALQQLNRIGGKNALDRIVSMLDDSNAVVGWAARSSFRRLSAQRFGPDSVRYKQWWDQHRDDQLPQPRPEPLFELN